MPYKEAINHFNKLIDLEKIKSPFDMIKHVVDTTKYLEESISNFW